MKLIGVPEIDDDELERLSIRAEEKVDEVRQYILTADIAFTQMALIFYHYEILPKEELTREVYIETRADTASYIFLLLKARMESMDAPLNVPELERILTPFMEKKWS